MPFTDPSRDLDDGRYDDEAASPDQESAYGCPRCLEAEGEAPALIRLMPCTSYPGHQVPAPSEHEARTLMCRTCLSDYGPLEAQALPLAGQGVEGAMSRYRSSPAYAEQHATWAYSRILRATTPDAYRKANLSRVFYGRICLLIRSRIAGLLQNAQTSPERASRN
ncbi:MAG: hypothetical protein LCH53_13200 [Bacteroidetes bacterium]|nr:hypothetical protein [Bacteroidota bacterium]